MTRFRPILAALVTATLLLPMGAGAVPADTIDGPTPEGFVQAELKQNLTSGEAARQERAMRRIRAYAYTGRYDASVFRPLVPALHDLVADGDTIHRRLMALSALDAIGSDLAMMGLQAQADEFDSELLRQTTETVLARYAARHTDLPRPSRAAE
jgi:hypothetical protein